VELGENKGIVFFIAFCLIAFAFFLGESPEEYIKEFNDLPLNAKGDALAGFFGSLAFVAALVAIILQSNELAAQREELRLTRKEFGRMAKAQEMQEKLLNEQYLSLTKDAKMRDADNEFEELIQALRQTLYTMDLRWEFEQLSGDNKGDITTVRFEFLRNENLTDQAELESFRTQLWMLIFDLELAEETAILKKSPDKAVEYPSLTPTPINRLCHLEEFLSPAKRTKLEYLGIKDIRESLEKLRRDKWWLKYRSNS